MSDTSDRKDGPSPNNQLQSTDEVYRDYTESRRPLHRARIERALTDANKLLDQESKDRLTRREIESAIESLERLSECFADIGSIEALDVRVLCRLPGLDEVEHDVVFFSPVSQCQRDKLRAVVHSQFFWVATEQRYSFQNTDHSRRR